MTREEFIQYMIDFRPSLRSEPDYSIVVFCIAMRDLIEKNISSKKKPLLVPREVLFDAIAELVPAQREFWLRCEATDRERFIGGMTALFSGPK